MKVSDVSSVMVRKAAGGGIFVLYFFSLACALRGIDFGVYWTEARHIALVTHFLDTGVPLPNGFYNYPSLLFYLTVSALAVEPLQWLFGVTDHISWLQPPFDTALFSLNARGVCAAFSLLAGIWIYFTTRFLRGPVAGFFAAATYLLSWEIGYHARWVAPDLLLAHSTAAYLYVTIKACRTEVQKRRYWLLLAAGMAGVAASSKYQGGALIIPVIVLASSGDGDLHVRLLRWVRVCVSLLVIFVIGFLLVTPGAVFEPVDFVVDVLKEVHHYRVGHQPFAGAKPYDVPGYFNYLLSMWEYFAFSWFSSSSFLSFIMFFISLSGSMILCRIQRRIGIVLISIVAFYFLYFPTNSVFIVRNFLFMSPIFCIWYGVAIDSLRSRIKSEVLRSLVATLALIALIYNGVCLYQNSASISNDSTEARRNSVKNLLSNSNIGRVFVSPRVLQQFVSESEELHSNLTRSIRQANLVLILHSDVVDACHHLAEWPAYRHNSFQWIGKREVNYNYYPSWAGDDRILILRRDQVRRYGLLAGCDPLPH